ncbi:MAG: GntR family transcriptional regulator, partial [Firmicutes bacterium]|nr:GntR family transcriptional regulator [Bacillota bacterium]
FVEQFPEIKLRNAILSGVLEPGQRLLQDELAAEMSVGHMPVREALLRLEAESLVNFHTYKGFTVASFTLDDLKEIYFLRGLLEGAACRLAAKNLSDKELDELEGLCKKMERCLSDQDFTEMPKYNASFHEIIYSAAKSPRLYKMIVKLWNSFLKSSFSFLTLRAPVMVDEHKAIYQALRSRNPEEAKSRIQDHIASALKDLSEYWSHRLISMEEE